MFKKEPRLRVALGMRALAENLLMMHPGKSCIKHLADELLHDSCHLSEYGKGSDKLSVFCNRLTSMQSIVWTDSGFGISLSIWRLEMTR